MAEARTTSANFDAQVCSCKAGNNDEKKRSRVSDVKATLPAYYLVQVLGGAINYGVFSGALLAMPSLRDALIVPLTLGSLTAMILNFALCRQIFKMASAAPSV